MVLALILHSICDWLHHRFGPGTGHIWLDEVVCHGDEYFIHQCDHGNFGENDCNHNEDAGVICLRECVCMCVCVCVCLYMCVCVVESSVVI